MGEERGFWSNRESEPGRERRESSKEYEQEEEEGLNMWSTLVVSVHPGGVGLCVRCGGSLWCLFVHSGDVGPCVHPGGALSLIHI